MKIIKNIFGSKPKQNSKYEPNTLAEMNESPDLRLATAKEKETDIPLPKSEEIYKIPRSSTKSPAKTKTTAKKASNSPKIISDINETKDEDKTAETVKKSAKSTPPSPTQKNKQVSKATPKKDSSTKETSENKAMTKTSETKKSASAPAKKAETKAKPVQKKEATVVEEKSIETTKTPAKTAAKTTTTKKPSTSTSKKQSEPITKNTEVVTTTKKTSAKKTAEKPEKASVKQAESSESIVESKPSKTGKFEIKKSKDGRFVFNLYASNNLIVATSQVYTSSTSAMNGIKSVISNASTAPIEDQTLKTVVTVPFPKWEIYRDKGDEYRFRLCASNGSCVCHSQGYTSKANCKKGIESIIKFASDAEITKAYLDKDK